MFTTLN